MFFDTVDPTAEPKLSVINREMGKMRLLKSLVILSEAESTLNIWIVYTLDINAIMFLGLLNFPLSPQHLSIVTLPFQHQIQHTADDWQSWTTDSH